MNLTAIITIAGIAVAIAGTLIEISSSGPSGVGNGTKVLLRILGTLSLVAAAVLLSVGFRRGETTASAPDTYHETAPDDEEIRRR